MNAKEIWRRRESSEHTIQYSIKFQSTLSVPEEELTQVFEPIEVPDEILEHVGAYQNMTMSKYSNGTIGKYQNMIVS